MLTPKNIEKNWILSHVGFIVVPLNKGNQWIIPAIIAKTAPMDST
jgi:hypothetical protein